ncbi:MAG: hypothetical protein A2942_00940 [Candidatus Lloydbacteria bacterium RIFCSPLOWO2_01_FULL_50_20]|uniref:Uncharacterized protein n=1 Tax=Candidatus Lloydbacteria bacterium RIFCSPLOWO2_01_FULL_50_20 TaxID=1798665 RepID=A0A1G2DF76_9BACT|nr:MAG: hypothetical protein A3C13_03815 [Candidatus Lloydbacteria bacterium RIFCSPHIGHO2_02_FULL_50_11]OGZ12307.1 MAG: hypothetical protein A2942_00940 [Candidatus Lloydbacteria bacterium RIFCSPLOWO2_01_FULL_50_20]
MAEQTTIHVFGNPDLAMDSLPLRILPQLRERFPDIHFLTLDPNEEWDVPDPFILIDTVVGLPDVHFFQSLDEFGTAPTVSVHDFDALFNLRYLKKLGKLKGVRIIGLPPDMDEAKALADTKRILTNLSL